MKISLYLAIKNLMTHKGLFVFVIVILLFSFVNLTFFSALNNGIEKITNEKLRDYSFGDLRILPQEEDLFIEDTNKVLKQLEKIPGIKIASERVIVSGIMFDGENSMFGNIVGVNINKELFRKSHQNIVARGNYISNGRPNKILLGQENVGRIDGNPTTVEFPPLDVGVGDEIQISFENNAVNNYSVGGIYVAGFWIPDFDSILPIAEVRRQFNLSEDISSQILLDLEEGVDKENLKKEIINSGIDLKVEDSIEELAIADNILEATRISTYLGTLIGGLTTFIVVFILIFISVNNSKKQLGILKAIGINGSDIIKSYVILSFIYAILGTLMGVITVYTLIFFLINNPIYLPVGYVYPIMTYSELLLGSIVLIISSLLGGFLASYNTIQKNIVDVLRGTK